MENEDILAPVQIITPKKSEITRNLETFGNKYGLVAAVVWYKRKNNPHEEINLVDIREEINYSFFTWAKDLFGWMFRTSISGLILWYLMFMLFIAGPPFYLFFVFGLAWWTLMRFIKEIASQVRQ